MSTATADRTEGERVVKGRHSEYNEFDICWRWLQDSLEGGLRYRDADYGQQNYTVTYQIQDPETGRPIDQYRNTSLARRNLIRHPQEYPVGPGRRGVGEQYGEGGASTGDEYEFRRALTPVPDFVQEAIGTHLARIYTRKVRRVPPPGPLGEALAAWWEDVDGAGTQIDDWMQETIAPLFLVLGQLDLAFDRPPVPDGEEVGSAADAARLRLDTCVASYILPVNLLDWELQPDRTYRWCNVREWTADGERFRHWTAEGWTLYDAKGQYIKDGKHPYGCVPIRRGFDVRKPRCENVGQSNYEQIAEIQRTYYNVDSELTLMNSLAAHPMLSGPKDLVRGIEIHVGPGNVLPKPASSSGQYGTWNYVSAPSEGSDRLRAKLQDLRDAADRAAALTKPAGARGTTGHTVSQSGVSKMMDQSVGNDLLTRRARSLERLETMAACKALEVLNGGPVDPEIHKQVVVAYPTKFDLYTAADFAALIGEFQALLGGLEGQLPVVSGHLYSTYERMMLSGLDDQDYRDMDSEMEDYIAQKQERAAQLGEAATQFPFPQIPPGGPTTD